MFGYYYGFDRYYILLVVPCILLALWAQYQVKANFNKYSQVRNRRGITGAQAAAAVLQQNGVTGVRFERVAGNLTDHYDPRDNVIRLSSGVYDATSVAAIGIACHEAGHAVQYANEYLPIRLRAAIVPITNIGSTLFWPLLMAGLIFNNSFFINAGIILFSFATVFQLVTLPVELDASRRALLAIENGYLLDDDEYPLAKKTLWAAAMTYVAALATSLAQLLRLLLLFGGRNRDD